MRTLLSAAFVIVLAFAGAITVALALAPMDLLAATPIP